MLRVLLITWLFCVAVTLLNPLFLTGLALPPLLLLGPGFSAKWLPFLVVPLVAAALMAILSCRIWPGRIAWANLVFWAAFFVAAEIYKGHMIRQQLPDTGVACLQVNSFFNSVALAGREPQFRIHAAYVDGEGVHLWSYRDRDFYAVKETIYRNLDLGSCEPAKQGLSQPGAS